MRSAFAQRRGDVPKCERADAALGLRGFAGVVDDERVYQRQGADERFRPTILREGDGLAGEPLKRAVRADVNEGVCVLLQPEVEGNVGVAGRAREVVILVFAGLGRAAFGL